jgi:glycosyltransferase involved in cell wall biosynthesis
MPTYNRKGSIPLAVKSVIDQTLRRFELIIVNDAGEDVGEIVESFKDERIRYISLDRNRGKQGAVNEGIRASRCPHIAYLDDDDIYYPNHLMRAVGALEHNPRLSFVYADTIQVMYRGTRERAEILSRRVLSHEYDRESLLHVDNYLPNLSYVHRKDLFDKAGLYDESLKGFDDWDMLRRFSAFTDFHHLPEVTGEVYITADRNSMNAAILRNIRECIRVKSLIRERDITAFRKETAEDFMESGRRCEKDGSWTEALSFYRRAAEKEPDHAIALQRIGRCCLLSGKLDEGKEALLKAVALRPDFYESHMLLAECLEKTGSHEAALSSLAWALITSRDVRADSARVYALMADCYSSAGEMISARICNEKSAELKSFRYLEDRPGFKFPSRMLLLVHPLIDRDIVLARTRERYSSFLAC